MTLPIFTADSFNERREPTRASICWADADHRYHLWVKKDRITGRWRLDGDRLYKNPPMGQSYKGYPRELDVTAKANTQVVEAAKAFANSGVIEAKAAQALAEEEAATQAANAAAAEAVRDLLVSLVGSGAVRRLTVEQLLDFRRKVHSL